jgi:catechol 2,3-dioxygenase-like lactoylglutathione lyase family enzyme
MNVQRICFLGTRTPNFDATSALFRDVLGLHNVHTEAGWSIFQLPSGRSDFVEVFGPEYENASVFPAEVSEGVVVAFAVDDVVAARDELAAARVEMIGELVWANELFDDPNMEGFGWFFFRGPDGNVYVIQQDSRADVGADLRASVVEHGDHAIEELRLLRATHTRRL